MVHGERPWQVIRAELLAHGRALEVGAVRAFEAGDGSAGSRLAGERDAYYHVAAVLGELPGLAAALGELPELVCLARNQLAFMRMRESQRRGRPGLGKRPVRFYEGLLAYWEALLDGYGQVARLLRSGQPAGQPEEVQE